MPKKNTTGGSRHKKMASKTFKEPRIAKMRFAEEGESYARVLTMYGHGNMEVLCNDKVKRLCVIRRKHKGKNKRDNMCSVNSMILIGFREWQGISAKKRETVDLLYKYDTSQMSELKNAKDINMDILPNFVTSEIAMGGFEVDRTMSTHQEIIKENDAKVEETVMEKSENKIEGVDWDDI